MNTISQHAVPVTSLGRGVFIYWNSLRAFGCYETLGDDERICGPMRYTRRSAGGLAGRAVGVTVEIDAEIPRRRARIG
jgi:hypothetical protein